MNAPIAVPNQINISVGGTVYDILKELRDILPQYQMYFDVDGVFHYNLIPSGTNEQVAIDDDIFKATLTEYSIDTDFEGIKNEIVVIGKTHDISYYGIMAISSNAGTITITDASLSNNLKIGFNTSTNGLLSTINLNAFGAKQLLDEYGNAITLTDVTDKYYIAKISVKWRLLAIYGRSNSNWNSTRNKSKQPVLYRWQLRSY